MAQEEYIEIAKPYAKEERALGVEVWVKVGFTLYRDTQFIKTLKTYDLPRGMLSRWQWLIHWRYCWFVCHYPRFHIHTEYSYYDKKRGIPAGFDSALNKLISAKAQVTKIQNAIAQYSEEKKQQLFSNLEEDPIYIRSIKKLEEKKQKVTEAETVVTELVKRQNINQ